MSLEQRPRLQIPQLVLTSRLQSGALVFKGQFNNKQVVVKLFGTGDETDRDFDVLERISNSHRFPQPIAKFYLDPPLRFEGQTITKVQVIEYIQGTPLSTSLITKPGSVVRELVDQVDFLHQNGIVHMDINNENIIVSEGRVILIDFGQAFTRDNCVPPSTYMIEDEIDFNRGVSFDIISIVHLMEELSFRINELSTYMHARGISSRAELTMHDLRAIVF